MVKSIILLFIFSAFSFSIFGQNSSKKNELFITDQVHSETLNEVRTINIYLPDEYNFEDTVRYPVVYVVDGGIDEDFFHIAGLVKFNTQPWIARFPKSIVIGIENTNRKRDFTFAVPNLGFLEKTGYKKEDIPFYGGSERYISFLEKELMPYIESKYNASRQRTIIGESLAGLLCTEILLKHSAMFSTYLIISPSLWWGNESLLKLAGGLSPTTGNRPLKIYIGVPNKKENKRMFTDAKNLYKSLKKQQGATTYFKYFPDELHSTVFHIAVYEGFKKLYPKAF